jgi:hypothetical protein
MGKGKGKNVIMMRVTSALKFCCFVWFYSLDWTVDLLLNSSWKRSGDSRKFVLKITNSKKQNIHLRRSSETRYFLIHFCWPEISLEINKKLEIKGRSSCCASLIAVENWGNSREVHSCAKNFGLGSSWQLRMFQDETRGNWWWFWWCKAVGTCLKGDWDDYEEWRLNSSRWIWKELFEILFSQLVAVISMIRNFLVEKHLTLIERLFVSFFYQTW